MNNVFGVIPSKKSFEKARDFIMAHPSFSCAEYLRLFIKKYCKDINPKKFANLLVYMFDAVENEEV